MAIELKVPEVGESITEVEIGEWLKAEGEWADLDDSIVVIETDKVTVELPAPVAGTVTQVLKKQGEMASVGEVIGYMEESAAPAAPAKQPAAKAARRVAGASAAAEGAAGPGVVESAPSRDAQAVAESAAPGSGDGAKVRVTPVARRLLEEHGISPLDVQATGPGNRLLKEDVMRHLSAQGAGPAQVAPQESAAPPPPAPAPAPVAEGARREEVVPMSPLRRRIAERLVQAQQQAALLTTFNDIDMSAVIELRKKYRDRFQEKYGIKLGFMSFFVKATIDALREVPQLNAEVRGTDVVYRDYYDIGVAVGGGRGLVVPVIRNADRMSFAEVELAIADLAGRALANELQLEELQGGTFTISNGGIYGSLLSTPIVNPPQSGILGLHRIEDRAVAIAGAVAVRPMMYVALTYDHRIVDGREAVMFLKRIKEVIEEPSRMLIEV